MIAVYVGCLIGPALCIMAMAVGLVLTRNDADPHG
jgi:hypothetical protein